MGIDGGGRRGWEAGKEAGAKSETEALERMEQRRASAGGECYASPRGKGHPRGGILSSGARREMVRPVRLPSFSYLGTKFLRSESSLTSPREVLNFSGDLPSFLPVAGTGQQ